MKQKNEEKYVFSTVSKAPKVTTLWPEQIFRSVSVNFDITF